MRPVIVLAVWLLFGAVQGILTLVTRGLPLEQAAWALPFGLLVGLTWAALTPVIAGFTRWLRKAGLPLAFTIGAHATAALVVAGAAAGSRWLLLHMLNPGQPASLPLTFLYWLDLHVVLYLTVAGVVRTLELHREVRDRTRQTLELQAQLARARLQFLQRQLQPHFLFNALNAVIELAHEAPEVAERMIRRLQQLLRIAMSRADVDLVPLREELATLEPFIDIQRVRFMDRLTVERKVDPKALEAMVPTLVLQPLVENAIQHGLASREGGFVGIEAEVLGDRLRIRVRDNGAGLGVRKAGRRGIGLRNTHTRLAQLFGEEHRFELRDGAEGGGTGAVVELEIPFRTAQAGEERMVLHTGEHAIALELGDMAIPGAQAQRPTMPSGEGSAVGAVETAAEDTPLIWRAASSRPPQLSTRTWIAIAAVWAAFALFWTNQVFLYRLAFAGSAAAPLAPSPIVNWPDVISAAIWAAFTPLVVWLARRFPVTRRKLGRRIALHLMAALVLDLLHVRLVFFSGVMGDLPLLSPNLVSPLLLNVLIYAALLTWSHGRDYYAWYREREMAAARLEAAIARAQWRMLCVELRPEWILMTLDAIAERVRVNADAAERLIARLADVLRVTLDAAREPVTTLSRELERLTSYVEILRETRGAEVKLTLRVDPDAQDAGVPSGLLRALLERLLAPEAAARAGAIVLAIDSRIGDDGEVMLLVSSSVPLAGVAGMETTDAWRQTIESAVPHAGTGITIEFPDPRSAVVRLAPSAVTGEGVLPGNSPLLAGVGHA